MAEAEQKSPTTMIFAGVPAQLARRYMRALYDLAAERKALDTTADDLKKLLGLWCAGDDLRALAGNPRLKRTDVLGAMKKVAEMAKLAPLTTNFVCLLAQSRRLTLLPAIVDAYLKELAKARGEYTADVRAATALSAQQTDQLATNLAKIAGGKVHVVVREDKSLLGGFVVKLGSRLIDASVKGRLERLERQLQSSTYQLNTQKGAA